MAAVADHAARLPIAAGECRRQRLPHFDWPVAAQAVGADDVDVVTELIKAEHGGTRVGGRVGEPEARQSPVDQVLGLPKLRHRLIAQPFGEHDGDVPGGADADEIARQNCGEVRVVVPVLPQLLRRRCGD